MMDMTENIVDILRELMDNQADQMWTCLPGSIISHDKSTGTAQVKLEVKLPLSTGELLEVPPIDNVPVQGLETTEFYLDINYPKGTGCILLFSSVALGNYLANTGDVLQEPENLGKFSLTDAIAIPTIYPKKKRPDQSKAVKVSIADKQYSITTPDGCSFEMLSDKVVINNNLEVLK